MTDHRIRATKPDAVITHRQLLTSINAADKPGVEVVRTVCRRGCGEEFFGQTAEAQELMHRFREHRG